MGPGLSSISPLSIIKSKDRLVGNVWFYSFDPCVCVRSVNITNHLDIADKY